MEIEALPLPHVNGPISGLELPDIICDVIDLLAPDLTPLDLAYYLYLLRHSVIEHGTQYCRVSRRGLQSGIVKSSRPQSNKPDKDSLNYATVQESFMRLEALGAIKQAGDTNREGTLYLIKVPDEIQSCQDRRAAMVASVVLVPQMAEVDYYNVRENRLKIFERDHYKCVYCRKQLTRFSATLDHVHPVREGGDNSEGNLVTACLQCNSKKNFAETSGFIAKRT